MFQDVWLLLQSCQRIGKTYYRLMKTKLNCSDFCPRRLFVSPEEGKTIYSTIGTEVLCSLAAADVSSMAPCSHEEADTRLFLHVADAVRKGFQKVMVPTGNTDVVVLAIAMFNQIGSDELWLAFGTRSNFRYIPVHDVVAGMGSQNLCNSPCLPCINRM